MKGKLLSTDHWSRGFRAKRDVALASSKILQDNYVTSYESLIDLRRMTSPLPVSQLGTKQSRSYQYIELSLLS